MIQQAKLSGAGQAIAVDMINKRLEIACRSGADITSAYKFIDQHPEEVLEVIVEY